MGKPAGDASRHCGTTIRSRRRTSPAARSRRNESAFGDGVSPPWPCRPVCTPVFPVEGPTHAGPGFCCDKLWVGSHILEAVRHRARRSNGDVALTQHCKLLLGKVLPSRYGGALKKRMCTNLAVTRRVRAG